MLRIIRRLGKAITGQPEKQDAKPSTANPGTDPEDVAVPAPAPPPPAPKPAKKTLPLVIERPDHNLSRKKGNPNALKVMGRLIRHGYKAYLCGGCVRDILIERKPKDFDVVTNATPDEIRHLFRNCRLIGRRY